MDRVTMRTVAEKVGVSAMTVSNAYARPDQLSAGLRERILKVAADLGYPGPDPAARSLASGRTHTVGVLPCWTTKEVFTDEFYLAFLSAVSGRLADLGYAMTLLPVNPGSNSPLRQDFAMDGAIVFGRSMEGFGAERIRARGVPIVEVDQAVSGNIYGIAVDDRGGSTKAAQHLLDLGHRRFGVAGIGPDRLESDDPNDWFVASERQAGRLAALEPAGITPVTRYLPGSTVENGIELGRDLLGLPDRPTAILCDSDAVATGVLLAAADLGIAVPQELSVVGFDDTAIAARTRPPLTTVHQDITHKGVAAVDAVIAMIDAAAAGEQPVIRRELIPTHLVIRESTGPAPA